MSAACISSKTFWFPRTFQGQAQARCFKMRSKLSFLTSEFFCSPERKKFLLLPQSSCRCFFSCFVRHFGSSVIEAKWQIGGEGWNQNSRIRYDALRKCLPFAVKKRGVNTEISVNVPVIFEESLIITPEIEALADQLQHDGQCLVNLKIGNYKPAESANEVELSILLCNDKYIQKLNKQWLRKNYPTDVLSFPTNEIPGLSSLLLLGDIVISLDSARQQAEERQHTLLDEVRILVVHGLLHILGYDHELGPEAAREMEEEEKRLLNEMGWMGKGLIQASLSIDEQP